MNKKINKSNKTSQGEETSESGENKQKTTTIKSDLVTSLKTDILRQKKIDLLYHCLAPWRVPNSIPFPELSMYAEEFAKVSRAAKEVAIIGDDKKYCKIFQNFYDLVMKE